MKKFFAVAGASLLNGFYFILGWILLLGGFRNTFLFYVNPVLSAVTFLFLGSLFYRHLRLSRVPLWFCMNLLGEAVGWTGLFLLSPEMLQNLTGVFFILFVRIFMFAIVWVITGILWLIFRRLRKWGEGRDREVVRQSMAELSSPSDTPAKKGKGKNEKLSDWLKTAGICLCGLSVLLMGYSFYFTMQERPAEAYEDKGIYTFKASTVHPTQKQVRTYAGNNRTRTTTQTVYIVTYKTTEKSGYQWKEETSSEYIGKQWIREGKTTQRRVLSIKDTNTYITVEPKYTAESYVAHNRLRYTIMLLVGGLYVIGYGAYQLYRREKRRMAEYEEY
ncbi:MAG: hypothetical protein HFE44_11365 [Oscillospiraceae bacterium]|nr:hypothetical protein [Oscillospiraceae bacterium]